MAKITEKPNQVENATSKPTPVLAQTILEISSSLALPEQYTDLKSTIQDYLENRPDIAELQALEIHSEMTETILKQADKTNANDQYLDLVFELISFNKLKDLRFETQYETFKNSIFADDLLALKSWFSECANGQTTEHTKLVRCHNDETDKLDLYVIRYHDNFFCVYKSIGAIESNIEKILQIRFGMTHSELVVIRGLISGETPKSIAKISGKSIETIRTQFKSAAAKLGVSRQQEIVNFIHSISRIGSEFQIAPSQVPEDNSLILNDGRVLNYDIIGDQKDFPVFFFHDFGSGRHWPVGSYELFKEYGICVYSVSRAGFGPSSPIQKYGLQLIDSHVDDYFQLMEKLKITRCSLLGFGTGFSVAYRFALTYPKMVKQVVGGDIYPPALSRKDISNFSSGFFRSSVMAAYYAPRTHVILSKVAAKHAATIRSGKDLVQLMDVHLNITDDELEEIFETALKSNFDDLEKSEFEGSWRDCSFVPTDWAHMDKPKIIRPQTTIFQHRDFPYVKNEFVISFTKTFDHDFILEDTPFAFQFTQAEDLISKLSPLNL